MITRISGLLVGLNEFCATIRIGGFDYEVLLPDIVRRQLQAKVDTEVSLRTIEYLEGNPAQGRLTPRMIGFMNEAELEFFDQVCSVDGLGVKKCCEPWCDLCVKSRRRSKKKTSRRSVLCLASDQRWLSALWQSCDVR